MSIHKEGYRIVYSTWALFILTAFIIFRFSGAHNLLWLLPFIVIPLFVTSFFRKPTRAITLDQGTLLSPCDGKVVVLEKIKVHDEECWTMSIFMSVWNVHINWIPISGSISYSHYMKGKFLVAWEPKSSDLNEQSITEIKNTHGTFRLKQIAGAVARRIITYPTLNQAVTQGEEMGFIRFGSRVDITFPLSYKPEVAIGQKVTGLSTILATHKEN